jgi:hypothetical protein
MWCMLQTTYEMSRRCYDPRLSTGQLKAPLRSTMRNSILLGDGLRASGAYVRTW